MKDVNYLDRKLQNEADKKLQDSIDNLFSTLHTGELFLDKVLVQIPSTALLKVTSGSYHIYSDKLIQFIKKALFKRNKEKYRKNEVDKFLTKIDKLKLGLNKEGNENNYR